MASVKLFIDFWNFQLGWNENTCSPGQKPIRIAWKDVPSVLIGELPSILGTSSPYIYKGTRVYASVNPLPGSKDLGLKKFLHNVLGQMTGFQVNVSRSPAEERLVPAFSL